MMLLRWENTVYDCDMPSKLAVRDLCCFSEV